MMIKYRQYFQFAKWVATVIAMFAIIIVSATGLELRAQNARASDTSRNQAQIEYLQTVIATAEARQERTIYTDVKSINSQTIMQAYIEIYHLSEDQ